MLKNWLRYLEAFPTGLTNVDLSNVKTVANKLDLLTKSAFVIVVGGTNGKGSCVAFLESILLAAGFRVGAYISPHLLHYNERIRINAKNVSDKELIAAFERVESTRGELPLSYFEFTTLTALQIFKQYSLDFLILEIGLGGRLDAVNLVDADLAILSSISLEHTQILGKTRAAIAGEKAWIMREGKSVVCGDPNPPKIIFEHAAKIKAKLFCNGLDFNYKENATSWEWQGRNTRFTNLPPPKLPLVNAATSMMAINVLAEQYKIPESAIRLGLQNAFLPGRYQQVFLKNKTIIFDVAHNPESAELLAKKLFAEKGNIQKGRILAVMSMLQDKDIKKVLSNFEKIIDVWYVAELSGPRATPIERLKEILVEIHAKKVDCFASIAAAVNQAIADCTEKDRIVIFGSFHVVSEAMIALNL